MLLSERKKISKLGFTCLKGTTQIRPGDRPVYQGGELGEEVPSSEIGLKVSASGYYGIARERTPKRLAKAAPATAAPVADDWKTMALECLEALRIVTAHQADLLTSNPGYLGKLVLQDYGLLNESLIKQHAALAKYQHIATPKGR